VNACGLNCAECPSKNRECKGCDAERGKPFWTAYLEDKICPLFACAQKKGFADCGACPELPCGIWLTMRDPSLSDEAFEASLQQRLRALRGPR